MKSTASTSEKILDIAQSLIIVGGYNGFSYADISAAIGIRKASIHHHFPTKVELVVVLVDRYRQQAEAGLTLLEKQHPNPVDRLQSYLNFWQTCVRDASQSFCVCAMLASEMPMLPQEVAARVRGHFDRLARWLTTMLQAGAEQDLFRLDRQPEEKAQMLMASVHGAMLSARAFDDPKLFIAITNAEIAALLVRNSDRIAGPN
jgi:TetR/AcrR family transcriptional repressor of nem operon